MAPRVAMGAPAAPPAEGPATTDPSPLPSRESVSDAMISAYVKAGLLSDPAMKGADVSVNTDHGVVNLTGTVKSREQAAIAAIHAQRPDGVMRIESHLAVDAG
ncbi:MAG: BON domain-containing protein [Usitatibacter sp.]